MGHLVEGETFHRPLGRRLIDLQMRGIHVRQPNQESAMFWIKMFAENLVQSVEGDLMNLDENISSEQLKTLKREFSAELEDPSQSTAVKSNSS